MSYRTRKKIIHLEDDFAELRQLKINDRITMKQFLKQSTILLKKIEILKKGLEESDDKKDNQ